MQMASAANIRLISLPMNILKLKIFCPPRQVAWCIVLASFGSTLKILWRAIWRARQSNYSSMPDWAYKGLTECKQPIRTTRVPLAPETLGQRRHAQLPRQGAAWQFAGMQLSDP